MYSDEEYYENLGITEYDLDLAEEFERLFPPEPTDEELELYMDALAEKYSDYWWFIKLSTITIISTYMFLLVHVYVHIWIHKFNN